jgi:NitT/TauT family transport system permease protein
MRFIFPQAKRPWKVALSMATILLIVAGWFLVTRNERVQPLFLPKPGDVIREIKVQFSQDTVFSNVKASLLRLLIAVIIGATAAVLLGTAITLNGYIRATVTPILYTVQFIPIAVFATLTIMVLGIYESPKVAFIAFGVFMQLLPTVNSAMSSVEQNYIRIGKSRGFSDWNLVRRIYLRRAAPQIFDGLRAALGLAWSFMVISEIIAGDSGIGLQLEISRRYHHIPTVFFFVIVIGLMGLITDWLLAGLRRRLFPWQAPEAEMAEARYV